LCQCLRKRGFSVRALVRNPATATHLGSLGVTLVEGDLANTTALEQLLSQCDAVIHCAGAVRGNSQADFDKVNVAGTAAMLHAIRAQARPPRLVLLSSIVAREPHISWYARSKSTGEQLLAESDDLDHVVIRPPAVYGPGDKEMLPIFECMQRGFAPVPGSPEARLSLIHVSDLVTAIIACLQSEAASGQTLTLCDGSPMGYNWHEMADIAAHHWSRRVRLLQIPHWLLNSIAALNSRLATITGNAPMLTPPKLRELRHSDWVVDNTAIFAATGWTPSVNLQQGLQQLKLPAL
jgi:nucleoside-diphosphate-sugar epimerase